MKLAVHLLLGEAAPRPWNPALPLDQRDHINYIVSDIEGAAAILEQHGVSYLKLRHPDLEFTQIFLSDPDGNVIEIGDCGVPEGLIACVDTPITRRTDLTPHDLHPAIRDAFVAPTSH